jgi:hydroxymethylbilane synthase
MVINRITAARVGTRGSALARKQTALALDALLHAYPTLDLSEHVIKTVGDLVTDVPLPAIAGGASGVFTSAIETALLAAEIDVAIHSAKDLPTEVTSGLILAAYLPRADVRDALISRKGYKLATLPQGAAVGTSSPRRAAQLRAARPDLVVRDLRGNIDTRIGKALAADGGYDAIVLARAGLDRLGRTDVISETLSLDVMLPAPSQGAICLQARDDAAWAALLKAVNDRATQAAVTAERTFLHGLGGGCALPVAAYGDISDYTLHLRARVLTPGGRQQVDVEASAHLETDWRSSAQALGEMLARQALDVGARRLMEENQ